MRIHLLLVLGIVLFSHEVGRACATDGQVPSLDSERWPDYWKSHLAKGKVQRRKPSQLSDVGAILPDKDRIPGAVWIQRTGNPKPSSPTRLRKLCERRLGETRRQRRTGGYPGQNALRKRKTLWGWPNECRDHTREWVEHKPPMLVATCSGSDRGRMS